MKLRFASPSLLVDLRRVPGLTGVDTAAGNGHGVRIGAMTTHTAVADAGLGLLSAVAAKIADPQVRNRGTIGGSLANAHPASDLPAVVLAAEGTIVAQGPGGTREIPAAEFFRGYLETALRPDEVITEVRLPPHRPTAGRSATRSSPAARRTGPWSGCAPSSGCRTASAPTCASG